MAPLVTPARDGAPAAAARRRPALPCKRPCADALSLHHLLLLTLSSPLSPFPLSGGMVFTFYKARGLPVGSSLVEEDKLELAKQLEKMAKEKVRGGLRCGFERSRGARSK